MKKSRFASFVLLSFFAIGSLFSLGSAVAAPSQSSYSEAVNDGTSIRSRSLSSAGVLTESTCIVSSDASNAMQHCVVQSQKLTGVKFVKMQADMLNARDSLRYQAALQAESKSSDVSVDAASSVYLDKVRFATAAYLAQATSAARNTTESRGGVSMSQSVSGSMSVSHGITEGSSVGHASSLKNTKGFAPL